MFQSSYQLYMDNSQRTNILIEKDSICVWQTYNITSWVNVEDLRHIFDTRNANANSYKDLGTVYLSHRYQIQHISVIFIYRMAPQNREFLSDSFSQLTFGSN